MSAPAWIAAVATFMLAVMAVITVLGTFQILPYPRLRPLPREPAADSIQLTGPPPAPIPAVPPRPPPSREKFEELEKKVAELVEMFEQLTGSFNGVANKMKN
jgi:hypothetical protein